MCGRVVQRTPLHDISVLFETINPIPNAAAIYNGAPTQSLPVVRLDEDGHRSLDLLRWGLIPFWAKDKSIGARCINAMCETVATKPAFRDAFRRRRCLVPADFFYEWEKTPSGKQPYAIGLADGSPMAFASLWERWKEPEAGNIVQTFTIITGPPNSLLRRFTTGCRSSCRGRQGAGGSARTRPASMIYSGCCGRFRPS
jgi:putative SOS response-associated peptidase YedK